LAGTPLWVAVWLVSLFVARFEPVLDVVLEALFTALEVWPAALAASVMASTSPVLQPA
jgi:hypothetical protein